MLRVPKALFACNCHTEWFAAEFVAMGIEEGNDGFFRRQIPPCAAYQIVLSANLLRGEANDGLRPPERSRLVCLRLRFGVYIVGHENSRAGKRELGVSQPGVAYIRRSRLILSA